jgi:hypothetical protein
MIKFSALYHEVLGRYSPNKGQNCSFSSPKILCRLSFDIFFVVFERAPQDAVPVRLTDTAVFNALSNKKKYPRLCLTVVEFCWRCVLELTF